jgi:hypothetical protein
MRTNRETKNDNYTTKGNVNPWTGTSGTLNGGSNYLPHKKYQLRVTIYSNNSQSTEYTNSYFQ